MVVLDLNLVKNYGLSSRQSSYLGAGDSIASSNDNPEEEDEKDRETLLKLRKASHLYLQSKNITKISPQINKLRSLKVIYLYDNKLKSVAPLSYAMNLTHVYLQSNSITTTRGLSKLKKLEKLYLGDNTIEVVEDIADVDGDGVLQELHIENQRLPKGTPLVFEPDTLQSLSHSLQTLNITGNNITNIDDILLACHRTLQKLDASNNSIKQINPILEDRPAKFPFLTEVILKGNPIKKKQSSKKYRQDMVVKFARLTILDDSEISSFERKWHEAFYMKSVETKRRKSQTDIQRPVPPKQAMIPPVPAHWRSRGLPGARQEFDKVLQKARASASVRLANEIAAGEASRQQKETGGGGTSQGEDIKAMGEQIKSFKEDHAGDGGDHATGRGRSQQVKLQPLRLAPLDSFDDGF